MVLACFEFCQRCDGLEECGVETVGVLLRYLVKMQKKLRATVL